LGATAGCHGFGRSPSRASVNGPVCRGSPSRAVRPGYRDRVPLVPARRDPPVHRSLTSAPHLRAGLSPARSGPGAPGPAPRSALHFQGPLPGVGDCPPPLIRHSKLDTPRFPSLPLQPIKPPLHLLDHMRHADLRVDIPRHRPQPPRLSEIAALHVDHAEDALRMRYSLLITSL